jgi:hypothetical protein
MLRAFGTLGRIECQYVRQRSASVKDRSQCITGTLVSSSTQGINLLSVFGNKGMTPSCCPRSPP